MEELYTINQAAIALKVHPLTIRRYIREGKLKAFRVGGNIRISLNDLRAFTQNFIPRQRMPRQMQNEHDLAPKRVFSINDSLFRMKARGLSLSKLEQ